MCDMHTRASRGCASLEGCSVTLKSALTVSVTLPRVHECKLHTATFPSNEAVEKTPGMVGHHCRAREDRCRVSKRGGGAGDGKGYPLGSA